ncbi:hypothetical protein ACFPM0_02520 [Pseudonocardia sulfidoxydans]
MTDPHPPRTMPAARDPEQADPPGPSLLARESGTDPPGGNEEATR